MLLKKTCSIGLMKLVKFWKQIDVYNWVNAGINEWKFMESDHLQVHAKQKGT